jgi:two-component system, chemotaxis family, sensor histidine kinase and response regulator PixL
MGVEIAASILLHSLLPIPHTMPAFDSHTQDQAYQFFITESLEFLQTLETGLLNLAQDSSTPAIHALMRAAHSIKGGAASIGLEAIKQIAHRLEDIFRVFYRQDVVVDAALEELLLRGYDCLQQPLLEQIQMGQHDAEAALLAAEPVFAQLQAHFGEALENLDQDLPTAAELGVDLVQVIFSTDIATGLAHLQQVLQEPDSQLLAGEFRAQAEVFMGMGELMNLPGFVAIAQTTIAALQVSPNNIAQTAKLALQDFQAAYDAVSAGDRSQGGAPSPALCAAAAGKWLGDADTQAALNDIFGSPPLNTLDHAADHAAETGALLVDETEASESLNDIFGFGTPIAPESLDSLFAPVQAETVVASPQPEPEPQPQLESVPAHLPVASPGPEQPPQKPPSANPDRDPLYLSNTIKVDLPRLDQLNNLVGELVTQENGAILQVTQLQQMVKAMNQRFNQFEQITKSMQAWSDKSHNARARLTAASGFESNSCPSLVTTPGLTSSSAELPSSAANIPAITANFDPLQLDSYSGLHTLVQAALEEMAQLGEVTRDMTLMMQQAQQTQRQKQQTLKQIRNDLLWVRMLPVGEILQRFPRMVRDLATRYGKQVSVQLSGSNTLVDKAVLEKLYDPLVHLVRNGFDHGIELPALRQAHGKPAQATLSIRAYYRGNQTYLEVQDDGCGIDLDSVRTTAIAQGLVTAAAAPSLTPEQLYEFLFTPGFSTAERVSELSGRGVGLDTVRSQVHHLKGTITVQSQAGKGTLFTIRLPLTLTIAKLLVFTVRSNLMALPVDTLLSIVAVSPEEIQTLQGKQFYRWQEHLIPLYPPDQFLQHYPLPRSTSDNLAALALPQNGKIPLLLIANETDVLALPVDQIVQEQDLVIKPFGGAISPPPYLYGCTILADGSLVPVMDSQALTAPKSLAMAPAIAVSSNAQETHILSTALAPTPPIAKASALPTILVVDDSLTARQTLATSLKKAGYSVVQAKDGREALNLVLLQQQIQAVFCDVEMPVMNGFEFLTQCRQSFSKESLPIIMVTSRSSEKHRQIAQYLGANSYLIKPFLEQEILKTLNRVLGNH